MTIIIALPSHFPADNDTLSCPVLTAPDNGAIDIDSTRVGAEVSLSCGEGYVLEGSSERTCLDNGTSAVWSGTLGTCNRELQTVVFMCQFPRGL